MLNHYKTCKTKQLAGYYKQQQQLLLLINTYTRCFIKIDPFFFLIDHSNDDQFTRDFYQL